MQAFKLTGTVANLLTPLMSTAFLRADHCRSLKEVKCKSENAHAIHAINETETVWNPMTHIN